MESIKRRSYRSGQFEWIIILSLVLCLSLLALGCNTAPAGSNKKSVTIENIQSSAEKVNDKISDKSNTLDNSIQEKSSSSNSVANKIVVNGQLKVHFIDVGQADSILVQQGSASMLIDAGNNGDSNTIKNYLVSEGVTSLDAVICTHAHEDHIGSMDYIIN